MNKDQTLSAGKRTWQCQEHDGSSRCAEQSARGASSVFLPSLQMKQPGSLSLQHGDCISADVPAVPTLLSWK